MTNDQLNEANKLSDNIVKVTQDIDVLEEDYANGSGLSHYQMRHRMCELLRQEEGRVMLSLEEIEDMYDRMIRTLRSKRTFFNRQFRKL